MSNMGSTMLLVSKSPSLVCVYESRTHSIEFITHKELDKIVSKNYIININRDGEPIDLRETPRDVDSDNVRYLVSKEIIEGTTIKYEVVTSELKIKTINQVELAHLISENLVLNVAKKTDRVDNIVSRLDTNNVSEISINGIICTGVGVRKIINSLERRAELINWYRQNRKGDDNLLIVFDIEGDDIVLKEILKADSPNVKIPDFITVIDYNVSCRDGVEIDTIEIPSSVKVIGRGTLTYAGIKEVYVTENSLEYLGFGAFGDTISEECQLVLNKAIKK